MRTKEEGGERETGEDGGKGGGGVAAGGVLTAEVQGLKTDAAGLHSGMGIGGGVI